MHGLTPAPASEGSHLEKGGGCRLIDSEEVRIFTL